MGDPAERAGAREWLRVTLRMPALWPLPAVLLLALMLPFMPPDAWRATYTTHRALSRAELALLATGAGCACYWLVLVLSGNGLYASRSFRMRDPSEAELLLVEAGLRFVSLFITYAGPALLI